MSVDLKYDVLCFECLCSAYPLESVEVWLEFCISEWNYMLQPYIESATAHSDYVKECLCPVYPLKLGEVTA